jgi:hypothetical protein
MAEMEETLEAPIDEPVPVVKDVTAMMVSNYFDEGFDLSAIPSSILKAHPKPRLTEEEKLERDCLRRRQTDLERRARIFDAKRRMIGVDKAALDQQVADKEAQKKQQYKEDHKGDRDMLKIDKQLKLLEIDKQRSRREQEMTCKEFSIQNLNYASRREFDLNDPKGKQKELPARIGDDDPRCGPASMQRFNGEDLYRAERMKQQQKMQVSFIEQQKFEKEMIKRAEADHGEHGAQVAEITALRNEIEENENVLRKELQKKQFDENMAQAEDNLGRKRELARQNMDANSAELEHHRVDKFLNECAPSHYNSRVIRDAYKGSTRQERAEVASQQRAQCMDNDNQKFNEAVEDKQFASNVEMTRRQLIMMEREKGRSRRAMAEQCAQDNKALQKQQQENKKNTNKLFQNEFSADFFEQFGKGCR